jgi:hypothetical protein
VAIGLRASWRRRWRPASGRRRISPPREQSWAFRPTGSSGPRLTWPSSSRRMASTGRGCVAGRYPPDPPARDTRALTARQIFQFFEGSNGIDILEQRKERAPKIAENVRRKHRRFRRTRPPNVYAPVRARRRHTRHKRHFARTPMSTAWKLSARGATDPYSNFPAAFANSPPHVLSGALYGLEAAHFESTLWGVSPFGDGALTFPARSGPNCLLRRLSEAPRQDTGASIS